MDTKDGFLSLERPKTLRERVVKRWCARDSDDALGRLRCQVGKRSLARRGSGIIAQDYRASMIALRQLFRTGSTRT